MGETLTQQRRVKEEGFRVVNFFYQGRVLKSAAYWMGAKKTVEKP